MELNVIKYWTAPLMGEGYKDKPPRSKLAAAWGHSTRAGVSHPHKNSWVSRRGKKILITLFILFFSLGLFVLNLFRLSRTIEHSNNAAQISFDDPHFPKLEDDGELEPLKPWTAPEGSEDLMEKGNKRRPHPSPSIIDQGTTQMSVLMPLDVKFHGENDLDVELCQLDIANYHRNPEKYPMANDLVTHFCSDKRRSNRLASELDQDDSAGRRLKPTGFIFHESRVGSTLVANILASIPTNLVYSEPHVPFSVIHDCLTCSEEETASRLRMAILAMGRSHHHDHFFIKFQSGMVPYMHLVLKAFPETPWIFIYRDPVEIMVSNFNKGHGTGPCIRHKKSAPVKVQEILGTNKKGAAKVPDEDYCAAHLAMLAEIALENLEKSGSLGRAVPYESLVSEIMNVIIPGHFGVATTTEEKEKMHHVSEMYSKSRNQAKSFENDSTSKHQKATHKIEEAAARFLSERTKRLNEATSRGRRELEVAADLRKQEDVVYEKTGSRFFTLPHCPDVPENPLEFPILDIINNWNPDDLKIPARHYSSLCRMDYTKDYEKAIRYRDAEVPFIVSNVPEFEETVGKWNTPGYLENALGGKKYHTEVSEDNQFLYYRMTKKQRSKNKDYVPPTTSQRLTYMDWLEKAQAMAKEGSNSDTHYYFRVSDPDNEVVRQDVTIFEPKPSLFMKEPEEQRGIHCRFGMTGVTAAAHFDASRNMVALVKGTRRWILAHPKECNNLYMLPLGHPSARHSQVNWGHPDLTKHPKYQEMVGHEVILTPGDVLYVPAWWIHYIVNLDTNIQCNSRSGDSDIGLEELRDCGFEMRGP